MIERYDIIGDIHGRLNTFRAVLARLGYAEVNSRFTAPSGRKLVSVGDVINKGRQPLECLELMQSMVEAGHAHMIIGNHEINAIHYQAGLRPRTPATQAQFATTLNQIEASPERWERAQEFILGLPNRLELAEGALRVVHAHWPGSDFPTVIGSDLVQESGTPGPLYDALQRMVKGPEHAVEPYVDKRGISRERDRIRWWEEHPADAPFTAFGHYCFPWPHDDRVPTEPGLLGPGQNAACLDFGAGIGDRLVALRWPECEFVVERVRGADL